MKASLCIVGSQSPRRQHFLQIMGFPFEVRVSDVDESFPDVMPLREIAEYLACKKASVLQQNLNEGEVLITADSTVLCNDKIYNKPGDYEEAVQMLRELSGKKHEVVTGVWIGDIHTHESFSVVTTVEFSELSADEIHYYVTNHHPYDKAGGYGIQDWIGTTHVKSIQGSYTNVMGLPTSEVYERLKRYFSDPNPGV